jgi:hypothetical protein
MALSIAVGPARSTKSDTEARRKQALAHAWESQLGTYCDPAYNYSRLLLRCPHGDTYVSSSDDFESYCTACFPKYIEGRPRAAQGAFGGRNPLVLIGEFGPGRLERFARKGDLRIQQKGYLDRVRGEDFFVPSDHQICPYDEQWRMRTAEAVGGYIRSGKKDGVAILAKRPKLTPPDWENDDLEAPELTLCTVRLPRPDSGVDIEPYRVILPVRIFTDTQPSESCRTYFDDERSVAASQSGLHRRIGSDEWADVAAPAEARISGKKRKPLRDIATEIKFDYRHFGEGGPIGRTCGECAWCRSLGLQGESIPSPPRERCNLSPGCLCTLNKPYHRSSYETFSGGSWPEDWRVQRKMRDLSARLNIYRYGDGHLQVAKMCETANENYRRARLALAEKHGKVGFWRSSSDGYTGVDFEKNPTAKSVVRGMSLANRAISI